MPTMLQRIFQTIPCLHNKQLPTAPLIVIQQLRLYPVLLLKAAITAIAIITVAIALAKAVSVLVVDAAQASQKSSAQTFCRYISPHR